MASYLIGDIQGCNQAFQTLLEKVSFSPSTDHIYLLGDLVNRGPDSLGVLRFCMAHEGSIHPVLGNHDLHLLAAAHGIRTTGQRDTLQAILAAPERERLLDWLARQPLVRHLQSPKKQDLLLLHAGVLPQWSLENTLAYAQEVQTCLSGPRRVEFLRHMYGNTPAAWHGQLAGFDRLRVIVNALTRLRFCSPEGVMDFASSEAADSAPAGLLPWFDCPQRQTAGCMIAFGHWSTLGLLQRPELLGLDTGCVWGRALTAMQINEQDFTQRQLYQIPCPQAQSPSA